MDGEVARRALREQGRSVHDSLREYTTEESLRVGVLRDSLRPWSGKLPPLERPVSPQLTDPEDIYRARMAERELRRRGGPPPLDPTGAPPKPVPVELVRRLEDTAGWFAEVRGTADRWKGLSNFDGWAGLNLDPGGACEGSVLQGIQPGARYSRRYLDGKVTEICRGLDRISVKLRRFQVSEPLVDVPPVVHAPRYARVNEGILARLLSEDLEVEIEAGRALEGDAGQQAPTPHSVLAWANSARQVLGGLSPEVVAGFTRLVAGATACSCPGLGDPATLGKAYLSLGLAYLEEVHKRMTDYAEASGQGVYDSKFSVNITGGTVMGDVYSGGHIAPVNIGNSATIGTDDEGHSDLIEALRALRLAVLAEKGLGDERSRELLDNVDYLDEVAKAPVGKRNRGIIKSALSALAAATAGGTELAKVMDAWGGVLHRLLS